MHLQGRGDEVLELILGGLFALGRGGAVLRARHETSLPIQPVRASVEAVLHFSDLAAMK